MSAEALAFRSVTRKYGGRVALDDVSLVVSAGEMFGLIGPDGAGKTTAIRIACGLLRPDSGEARIFERDPAAQHGAITGLVGYLSQRFSLYGDLTIDENIAFQAEIHGVRRYGEERTRLLDMTQLTPFRDRRADRLSGGMKQKLALACTLIHKPKLLLLDEPTTGVDPVSRREFWKLLSEFLADGLTIVMATPYLDEAERCGRVALLHEGRVMALDAPGALQAALPGVMLEVFAEGGRPPIELLTQVPGVDDVQLFGDRAHVRVTGTADEAMRQILHTLQRSGIATPGVRTVPASLEDVFIHLVTRQSVGASGKEA